MGAGLQASNNYLVQLGHSFSGPQADTFVVSEMGGGSLNVNVKVGSTGGNSLTPVRSWQVVDGGIVFETTINGARLGNNLPGTVYYWRANPAATAVPQK